MRIGPSVKVESDHYTAHRENIEAAHHRCIGGDCRNRTKANVREGLG